MTEKFTVIPYAAQHQNKWDDFVRKSKNGTFLFERHYMDYHHDRFVDASFMILENNKIVAVFPANRSNNTLFSHQGLSYGGMIVTEKLKLRDYVSIWNVFLKHLDSVGIDNIELKLIPNFYTLFPSEETEYLLFILNAQLMRCDAMAVIDNRTPFKIARNRMEGVVKGSKNGLRIEISQDCKQFWEELLIPNLKNKHQTKPVHTADEMNRLMKLFPNNIFQYNCFRGNSLVAGVVIFESSNVAHVQYIAGDDQRNEHGGLDYLHHYLIMDKYRSKQYFDFGTSNVNNGRNVNWGLSYWKETFGTQTMVQKFYKIEVSNYQQLENLLNS